MFQFKKRTVLGQFSFSFPLFFFLFLCFVYIMTESISRRTKSDYVSPNQKSLNLNSLKLRNEADRMLVETYLGVFKLWLWLREKRMSSALKQPVVLSKSTSHRVSVWLYLNVAHIEIQPSLRFTPNVYEQISIGRPRTIFYTRMLNVIYSIDLL